MALSTAFQFLCSLRTPGTCCCNLRVFSCTLTPRIELRLISFKMEPWDQNTMGASARALAAGADSSSNGSNCTIDRNSGKKKKRPRHSKSNPATVVITDPHSFRAEVHKFTGMPTALDSSITEDSERRPLIFKPRAQRGVINVPLTTSSTFCCNLPITDHVLKLPLIEGDHPVQAHACNSMLQLPAFSDNEALLFEELWEELELTENAAI